MFESNDAAGFLENEAVAARRAKISTKVRIQRWPHEGPVTGPSVLVISLEEAAKYLRISGFMDEWIESRIREHLQSGGVFLNHCKKRSDDEESIVSGYGAVSLRVRSEYRMATEQEVLDYVDVAEYTSVTGKVASRHAQETTYTLMYHEGVKLIELYDNLPRQAKVILDLLNEANRDSLSEASIGVILAENVEKLKTTQDPMKVFGFYRRRFVDEGHLVES